MPVKIPMVMRSRAKTASLRKWVDGKSCPVEEYFKSVDGYRAILHRHFPEALDPNYQVIVPKLAELLNEEESLYDHIAKLKQDTSKDDDWAQLCQAAAWVIADRYDKAMTSGEWPK